MGASFSNHDIHPTLACDPTEVRIPSYHSSLNELTPPDQDGHGHGAGMITKKEDEDPVQGEEGSRGGVGRGNIGSDDDRIMNE